MLLGVTIRELNTQWRYTNLAPVFKGITVTRLQIASLPITKIFTLLVNFLSLARVRYCVFSALILTACSDLQTLGITVKDGPGRAVNINAI